MQKIRLVPDLFLFSEKTLYMVKAIGLQLSFNIFGWFWTYHKIETNCIKFRLLIQRYVELQLLRKGSGNSFQEKCFLCYILFTDQVLSCVNIEQIQVSLINKLHSSKRLIHSFYALLRQSRQTPKNYLIIQNYFNNFSANITSKWQ